MQIVLSTQQLSMAFFSVFPAEIWHSTRILCECNRQRSKKVVVSLRICMLKCVERKKRTKDAFASQKRMCIHCTFTRHGTTHAVMALIYYVTRRDCYALF